MIFKILAFNFFVAADTWQFFLLSQNFFSPCTMHNARCRSRKCVNFFFSLFFFLIGVLSSLIIVFGPWTDLANSEIRLVNVDTYSENII